MGNDLQDKQLNCVDCGAQFLFTARDQAFYQERGYSAPRRCKTCRDKRKAGGPGGGGSQDYSGGGGGGNRRESAPMMDDSQPGAGGNREQFKVKCSACGIETTVPFKADPNRPVYCRTCYGARRKKG